MQSAYLNPQLYATPLAGQPTQAQPFTAVPPATQNLGMTQLPAMPRPPYLQSPTGAVGASAPTHPLTHPGMQTTTYVIPGVFGNSGATSAVNTPSGPLPTPCQAAPSLCQGQPPAYQTASSFPVNVLDPSAEIPSPYMVAPWLYLSKPQAPQVPASQPAQAYQQPQPKAPAQQTPPQQPQPPAPPPQPPAPAPAAPPQPPQTKGPSESMESSVMTDAFIRSMNERLNDDNVSTRSDAAMDFVKLLDKDPTLAEREPYSRYVNAFLEKILKDPSNLVRLGGEMALQNGRIKNPTPEVQKRLTELNDAPSKLTGEDDIISGILSEINNRSLGEGKETKAGAYTTDGLANAEQNKGMPNPPNGVPPAGQPGMPNPAQQNAPMPQGAAPAQPGAQPPQAQGAAQPQPTPVPSPPMQPGGMQGAQSPMPGYAQGRPQGQPMPPAGPAQPMPNQPMFSNAQPYAYPSASGMAQPGIGSRLNYLSQPAPAMAGMTGVNPMTGQRLNLQEGFRP